MIRIMYIDFQKLGIHLNHDSFSNYLTRIQDTVNAKFLTLRGFKVQGVSMTQTHGEFKTFSLFYNPARRGVYSLGESSPHPMFIVQELKGIDNMQAHINNVLTAIENTGRYINFVKILDAGQMDTCFTIVHTPLAERNYYDHS